MSMLDRPSLRVLVVAADAADSRFASGVLEDHDDEVEATSDVPEALARVGRESFDVAIVALSLPRGDGLALVHHLRALHPEVDVIVLAGPNELEESSHAMALGVLSTVPRPLTGDGLMVAVDRARERRALIRERQRLADEGATSRRRSATYARCAAFVAETDEHAVATQVLDACLAELDAAVGAIYLPVLADPGLFRRAAVQGDADTEDEGGGFPFALDRDEVAAVDPTEVVSRTQGRVRVLLVGGPQIMAVVDAEVPGYEPIPLERREPLEVVAALGTAAFTAARKVEAIARAGIKDPQTSAYTFAYFGDVAGREIDRAARHQRRFSLVTIGGEELLAGTGDQGSRVARRRAMTEALLTSVRDSDVVARVDEDEFYLLLPETGLLGALAARRRILGNLSTVEGLVAADRPGVEPGVGIAVYPNDGSDLGRLLRVCRRRAERSSRGVWRRLGLATLPFWDAVDRLLGTEDDAGVGRDGTIALHSDLRLAHDDEALARHAAMAEPLVPHLASAIASEAVSHDLAGSLYVAGSAPLASAVGRVMDASERPKLRSWSLGPRPGDTAAAARIHLPVHDPRLDERILVLSLTELGGYGLLARPVAPGTLLTYHAADLDLVDGLVAALQTTYHLQPEVR